MQKPSVPRSLKADVDRCVKCGMCLPECPTYRITADENESPRGRIALIEGFLSGRLTVDAGLTRHLDNCLVCRRCERVCPSQVPYGAMIDEARQLLGGRGGRLYETLTTHGSLMRWGTRLARAFPEGLSRPLGTLHRLHEIARALPDSRAPAASTYGASTSRVRGRVGLFTGCATEAQQGGAVSAALELLRAAGYEVCLPERAKCCGALAAHAGNRTLGERLAAGNRAAFDRGLDAVVSIASGCGIHLDSYDPPLPAPHSDIIDFLLADGRLEGMTWRPLARAVYLHTPCSVENVYRGGDWAGALLARIPQLEIIPIGTPGQCCGAAGDYMLRHPEMASALREPLIAQIPDDAPHILLTSNVGCAIHLADGLRHRRHTVEVLHPVELMARQHG